MLTAREVELIILLIPTFRTVAAPPLHTFTASIVSFSVYSLHKQRGSRETPPPGCTPLLAGLQARLRGVSTTRFNVLLSALALVACFGAAIGDEGEGMSSRRSAGSAAADIKATIVVPAYKEAPNSTADSLTRIASSRLHSRSDPWKPSLAPRLRPPSCSLHVSILPPCDV